MIKKIIIIIFCLTAILAAVSVNAASGLSGAGDQLTTTGNKVHALVGTPSDFKTTVSMTVSVILAIVGTIFLVMMVYAGVLWMTAAGKSEQAEKAQKIITESIIGLVITLSSYAITTFISTKLGSGTSPSGGTSKTCASLGGSCTHVSECLPSVGTSQTASDCSAKALICCIKK